METDDAAPDPQDTPADDNNNNNGDAQASEPAPPAPVVPGPRATRFQELYAQSLKRTLAKLKWDNFAACYPTVASKAEPVLKQVQTQMAEKLAEKCEVWALKKEKKRREREREKRRDSLANASMFNLYQREFESILVARQVVPKLNDLESLVADATHRRLSSAPDAPKPTPYESLLPSPLF